MLLEPFAWLVNHKSGKQTRLISPSGAAFGSDAGVGQQCHSTMSDTARFGDSGWLLVPPEASQPASQLGSQTSAFECSHVGVSCMDHL